MYYLQIQNFLIHFSVTRVLVTSGLLYAYTFLYQALITQDYMPVCIVLFRKINIIHLRLVRTYRIGFSSDINISKRMS